MNGSALARFGIGVLVACCAVPAAALADTPTLNPSGTLTFSWRGDPARGCQAAGVCAVSGLARGDPGRSIRDPSRRLGREDIRIEDDNSVVRVTDPGSTPSRAARVHAAGAGQHGLDDRADPLGEDCRPPASRSSRRPRAVTALVRRAVARRRSRFRRGACRGRERRMTCRARSRSARVPTTVTIKSTMRARRPSRHRSPESPGPAARAAAAPSRLRRRTRALVESVSLQYRITAYQRHGHDDVRGPARSVLRAARRVRGERRRHRRDLRHLEQRFEFDAQRVVKRPGVAARSRWPTSGLVACCCWTPASCSTTACRRTSAGLSGRPAPIGSGSSTPWTSFARTSSRRHTNVLFSLIRKSRIRFAPPVPGLQRRTCSGPRTHWRGPLMPARDLGRKSACGSSLSGRGRFVVGSYAGSHSAGVTLAMRLFGSGPGPRPRTCSRENHEAAPANRNGCSSRRSPLQGRSCGIGRCTTYCARALHSSTFLLGGSGLGNRHLVHGDPRPSPRRPGRPVPRRSGDGMRRAGTVRFLRAP